MKKEFSDEQLDALMRTVVSRSAADDSLVNEIAESSAPWWGVQRKINEQKPATLSAWPPFGKVLRWFMVGVPVTAAAVLILSFFIFRQAPNNGRDIVAEVSPTTSVSHESTEPPRPNDEAVSAVTNSGDVALRAHTSAKPVSHHVAANGRISGRNFVVRTETAAKTIKKEEIKTDFIALSYARDPESGQIVRVKVPSSLMVSLGVVTSVEKPSQMIDAEVLVGDDGLTRAIRFIR
jgi:hypothetical protein